MPRHLLKVAGRFHQPDLPRLRFRQYSHGDGSRARCRRAFAARELRRNVYGDADGGIRYSDVDPLAPKTLAPLMKT